MMVVSRWLSMRLRIEDAAFAVELVVAIATAPAGVQTRKLRSKYSEAGLARVVKHSLLARQSALNSFQASFVRRKIASFTRLFMFKFQCAFLG